MGVDLSSVTYSGKIKLETGNKAFVCIQGSDSFISLGLTCLGLILHQSLPTLKDTWGAKKKASFRKKQKTTFNDLNTKSLAMWPLRTAISRNCYEWLCTYTAHIPGPSLSHFEKLGLFLLHLPGRREIYGHSQDSFKKCSVS